MPLESIKYTRGSFSVLEQLKVPHEISFRRIYNVSDGVDVIKRMDVRGAPLIAVTGCLSIAIELQDPAFRKNNSDFSLIQTFINEKVEELINARPTAINMKNEGLALLDFVKTLQTESADSIINKVTDYIENLITIDIETNKAIGRNGMKRILKDTGKNEKLKILTHCNTGTLATCGYGTALGVVRALHENGLLEHVYFTEVRPYNQGSRLTAFELLSDGIPSTLICDSAASWLMKTKGIDAVVTGADRVLLNGDSANKIGTYQLALAAKAHNIPFYIAAPLSTVDLKGELKSGDDIKIEERSPDEVTSIAGHRISPIGVSVWNPSFDVTPGSLIKAVITENEDWTHL